MRYFITVLLSIFILGIIAQPQEAHAAKRRHRAVTTYQQNQRYAAFVVDGDTGKILYQENADKLRHPASLTKMMTLYLLFEALENRKISLDTVMTVSENAANRPATNMHFQAGDTISVREAILALIVRSANDVAVVVAEQLGGTEEAFTKTMTTRAHQLGMRNTYYKNANGLPDPQQVTTAKDQALLGIALKKHYPEYFAYFSRTSFVYNGTTYPGHNHVMENYPGADGLKTGYINASGYNLVTTATRRGISLVGVVLGGRTHQARDAQMIKLLDAAFEKDATLRSRTYAATDYTVGNKTSDEESDDDSGANAQDDNSPDDVQPAPVAATTAQALAAPPPQGATVQATTTAAPAAAATASTQSQQPAVDNQQLQNYDTPNYVNKVAAAKPVAKAPVKKPVKKRKKLTKKQRYKSKMVIKVKPDAASNDNDDSTPAAVPAAPKAKPQAAYGLTTAPASTPAAAQ